MIACKCILKGPLTFIVILSKLRLAFYILKLVMPIRYCCFIVETVELRSRPM